MRSSYQLSILFKWFLLLSIVASLEIRSNFPQADRNAQWENRKYTNKAHLGYFHCVQFTLSPENSQNCIPITGNNFGGQSYGVGELSSDAPMVGCYSGSDSECMCVSLSQQSQKCLANIALLTLQQ